jgi:hypothetical protein
MPHINSLGAGIYSDISFCTETWAGIPGTGVAADWQGLFATALTLGVAEGAPAGEFRRITNIREMPQMGTPPNIVNVPNYGYKTSRQVQGQADAPTFEVQLNFIPNDWQNAAGYLGYYVGNSNIYAFRFTLLNAEPAGYASTQAGLGTAKGGSAGSGYNTQYYFGGKLEALQINPQLTDASTATLTISIQTDLYGPFTNS